MLKLSDKELWLSHSDIYRSFIKRRSRLSWTLFLFLTSLVFIFNLLTIFTPHMINISISQGSAITLGITFAFLIILLIVLAAVYYVHWNNIEYTRLVKFVREQSPE